MTYEVTEYDKYLIRQHVLDLRIKIEVYDFDGNRIDMLEGGITDGSFNIDAESDIRRTFDLTVVPNVQDDVRLADDGLIWLDRKLKVYIGIRDQRTNKFNWYSQGFFVYNSASSTFDSTTNQMSLSCSDIMAMLDGSRCGNLGYLNYILPAYEEDDITGEVIKYNKIREAMITVVKQLGWQWVDEYEIEELGERKGMPNYALITQPDGTKKVWDYMDYRETTSVPVQDGSLQQTWNAIPFDQEFQGETTVLEIVRTLRDLYEGYETFFDIEGNFCCKLTPTGDDDPIIFDDDFFKRILISENSEIDFTSVKNMMEVWGEVFEEDFYAYKDEDISYTIDSDGNATVYEINIEGFDNNNNNTDDGYVNGDVVAVKIPCDNALGSQLWIKGTHKYKKPDGTEISVTRQPIYIYNENTEQYLEAGTMRAGGNYCFTIKKHYDTEQRQSVTKAYYMGEWQPHAIAVLTDGTVGKETSVDYYDAITKTTQTFTTNMWSKEFFEKIYNCNTVELTVNPDSPFTVQKIGIIPAIKTDDNIKSDSTALETALQENYRNCRLTDNITIETKICPFADVNQKVTFKPHDAEAPYEYIVKSLSHNLSSGTTSWTLMRYYRLYLITFENVVYG